MDRKSRTHELCADLPQAGSASRFSDWSRRQCARSTRCRLSYDHEHQFAPSRISGPREPEAQSGQFDVAPLSCRHESHRPHVGHHPVAARLARDQGRGHRGAFRDQPAHGVSRRLRVERGGQSKTEPFNRRDQRAVCCAPRAARRPVPLSTTPAPLRKPRARHELAWCRAAGAAGFRLRPGGGRCAPAAIR